MSSSAQPPVREADQLRQIADELAGQVREAETAQRIRQAADGAARQAAVILTQAVCRYDLGPVWNDLTVRLRIIAYQAEKGRRPTQDELGECCELSARTLAYLRRPPAPRLPAPANLPAETWAAIQPDCPPQHDALHTWLTVVVPGLRQMASDDFPLDRAEYDFTKVPRVESTVESTEARAIRQGRADGEPFDWAAYRRATEAIPEFGPPDRYTEPLARDHERGRAKLYETAMRVAADLLDEMPNRTKCGEPRATETPPRPSGRGKHINARMMKTIAEKPESIQWTAREWADFLGCVASTVVEAPAWNQYVIATRAVKRVQVARRNQKM